MRAKFIVQTVTELKGTTYTKGEKDLELSKYAEYIEMFAVYTNDPSNPNFEWSKATPSGLLRLQIDNPNAWGHFTVGQEIYLTITNTE